MTVFNDTEAQLLGVTDLSTYLWRPGAIVAEGIDFVDNVSFTYRPGASISEQLTVHHNLIAVGRFKHTFAELLAIHPSLAQAFRAEIAENIDLNDVVLSTLVLLVAEHLGLRDVLVGNQHSKLTLAEHIISRERLAWFLGGFLAENLMLTETLSPLWRYARVIAESIDVADTVAPTLVMRVILADNVDLNDTAALLAIYNATLSDSFQMSVAFVDPGGGFTAWAVNTRTGAITEYENFAFNSFAQMGHHFLGASTSGLYVLDGALDDAASVVARVKSGSAQFSGSHFTAFEAIYLGCRVSDSGRDWLLKLHAGDGREYVYAFRPLNRRTTKIFVGKGLRARYFSWELITAGEEFDLDSIEFIPIGSKRRV